MSAGSAGAGAAAGLQVGAGGESERPGWFIAAAVPACLTGQERAGRVGLGRAQDRVGEHEVGKPDAQVRHQDPARGRARRPGDDRLAQRRIGVGVAVEETRIAIREQLGAIVGEEQGSIHRHLGRDRCRIVHGDDERPWGEPAWAHHLADRAERDAGDHDVRVRHRLRCGLGRPRGTDPRGAGGRGGERFGPVRLPVVDRELHARQEVREDGHVRPPLDAGPDDRGPWCAGP